MPIFGPKLDRPVDLANVLKFGLKHKPDAPALVSLERTWTWSQLDEASTRLAAHYRSRGLAPGDRAASLLPNRGELLVHYLACFKLGAAATPLNYRYQAPEIDHALEVSGASLLVAHVEREDALAASAPASRLPLGWIRCGAEGGPHPRIEELTDLGGLAADFPPPRPDAPALIFFTSGSTGRPKGVTHSRESFGWILASAVAGLKITPDDVVLPATSASHVAATSLCFAGLAAGACVAVARSFGADEMLPLLRRARPTLLCMLPNALFGLVRDPKAALFGFCVAVMSYNVLAVVRAALRSRHGRHKGDDELSMHALADEIAGVYRGMELALPDEARLEYRTYRAPRLAETLVAWAGRVDLRRFRKAVRGPKKPPTPRRKANNKTHVSTHKLLTARRARIAP